MRGKIPKILLFLALILLPLGVAKALDTKTGDTIYISKDEIVSGNLYAAGNTITIDGTVNGDLIAAAQIINVNGRIEGDIIAAAQDIRINGEVGGNIRVAGNSININNRVARNVNAFGANVILDKNSQIGWDVLAAANNIETHGEIIGSLSGSAGRALISGKTGKNISLKLADTETNEGLIISPEAAIGGGLTYTTNKTAQIPQTATIGGKIEQKFPEVKPDNKLSSLVWPKIYSIFCAFVIGLILIFLGKNSTLKILDKIQDKPKRVILTGIIIMFAVPPISLFLMFTLIGIPLALILLAIWFIALYVSKIFTALLLGQWILKNLIKKGETPLVWSLIVGVILLWLLIALPFIGWIVGLFAIWLGLGGAYLYASNKS